jgi:hypothetical protein
VIRKFFQPRFLSPPPFAPGKCLPGMAAILLEFWLTVLAKRARGLSRTLGKIEMDGDEEIQFGGIYAQMRHPRCAGIIRTTSARRT